MKIVSTGILNLSGTTEVISNDMIWEFVEIILCVRCGRETYYEGICPRCVRRIQKAGGIR